MPTSESYWKSFFDNWPDTIEHRGVILTTLGEQIPFNGFMTSDAFVVFSRNTPDAIGARTVILPYEKLGALKMTDIIKSPEYRKAGFQGELGRQ